MSGHNQGAPQPGYTSGFAGNPLSPERSIDLGPTAKWGDPLSTDLLSGGKVRAQLRYYGEASGVGSTQAVGVHFTIAQ